MAPLNIIIIGGGIGGPAAAIGLARNGHRVTLIERASNTTEIGYAFRMTENSEACLQHLGIDAEAGGACFSSGVRLMNADGKLMRETKDNTAKQLRTGKSLFVYRPQLNKQLLEAATALGVDVKIGLKVQDVDVDSTTVISEDYKRLEADLIIAAEGVKSIARRHIVDESQYYPYASTGHNSYRFTLTKGQVENDELLAPLLKRGDHHIRVGWAGNKKVALSYPVDYGREYNMTLAHPQEYSDGDLHHKDNPSDSPYNNRVSREIALATYADYEPRLRRIIKLAAPDSICVWKQLDLDELPTWSQHHTVLLGDAAHAAQPFSVAGAGMAIEDAVTLEVLLPFGVTKEEVSGRLKLYEKLRKPRTTMVM